MSLIESVILGFVEGATEFLPISSTGHLILASSLLGIPQTDFVKTFEIAIQLGAIAAVVAVYFKSFFDIELIKKLVVAFVPTGIAGLVLYPVLNGYLIGNELVVLSALFAGGVVLILFEKWQGPREDSAPIIPARELTYRQCMAIGLAQAVAIIPGVSRSGATIIGGLALGIARPTIVEFSFLLAVPTILAATAYSLYKGQAIAYTNGEWTLLAGGFVTAFIVSIVAIRWLLAFVRSHSFTAFGIYRIILALVLFLYLFA